MPLSALNLERFGEHAPNFFVHSVDVELHGDLALVTGYGGLMIYDISESVEYLGRYNPGGGRGTPVYNCGAFEDIAFVTARENGMYLVDISDPANPSLIVGWRPQGESLEDAAYIGNGIIAVSAHGDGVHFVDVSQPDPPELLGTFDDVQNCWELAYDGESLLYIADGNGGLAIVDVSDETELVSRIETSGNAIDVKIEGDICAVAVGASGVDLFDVSDPAELVLLSNFDTKTYAGHIGFDGDIVAVADWNELLIYDVSDPAEPYLNGSRYTEYRAMGVDLRGESVYLADWSKVVGYRYGEIDGADIAFSTRRIVPPDGQLVDTTLTVYNFGQQQLEVSRIACTAERFEVDPVRFDLDSGDSIELSFSYLPHERNSYPLRFSSNDTDEPSASVSLETSGGIGIGDRAPDFTASILGGGDYRLSDMGGRIQLIIFWASW